MEGNEGKKESENTGCLGFLKVATGILLFQILVGTVVIGTVVFLNEPETEPEPNAYYFDYDEDSLLDYDCEDFSTSFDAQLFFEENGYGDPHDLDRDDDGYACEWNE